MKRALYSLANEEFIFFVNKLGEKLRERKIPHIFVGGTAVQTHVLNKLHKKTGLDISSLVSNEDIRLQDYIRATDDIDIALRFPNDGKDELGTVRIVNGLCKDVEGEYIADTGNYIFKYGLIRQGVRRPVFSVSVNDERAESIALNISRKPKDLEKLDNRFYNEFITAGEELVVPHYDESIVKIRVPKLVHVLATKISNFRAKDAMDIQNLVALTRDSGEEIDFEEIKRILLPEHTKNYEKFESLVDGS